MTLKTKKLTAAILTLLALTVSVAEAAREGPKGAQGHKGAPGVRGQRGVVGPAGVAGPAGVQGTDGTNGTNGTPGVNGAAGIVGQVGDRGLPGINGTPGIAGDRGIQGDPGAHAVNGTSSGQTLVWNGSAWTPVAPSGASVHAIGDQYQGGYIFLLDSSGQHGLITMRSDIILDSQHMTSDAPLDYAGPTGIGLYSGQVNTNIIIAANQAWFMNQNNQTPSAHQPSPSTAIAIALQTNTKEDGTDCSGSYPERGLNCYSDWYIPSFAEMASLTVYSVNLQNVPSGFNPLNTSTTSFQYLTSTLMGQILGQFPGQGQMTIMISSLSLHPPP